MKGAFMKKHICAMALTLALAAGGLSLASDLKMADGHILPLGNEMTLGKQINHMWEKNCRKSGTGKKQKKKSFLLSGGWDYLEKAIQSMKK